MNPNPRRAWWRHPSVFALCAGLVVLLVAFAPALWSAWTAVPGAPLRHGAGASRAPWELDPLADGAVRVAGLRLPGATLAEAVAAWGDSLQIALMATRGEPAALEAAVDNAYLGPVSGRLVFTAGVAPQTLRRWREHAAKEQPVSADTRRVILRAEDRTEAVHSTIVGIGFIPSAQLDAQTLRQRFGDPAEVLQAGEPVEHWLYPERGLAIMLDTNGRELLQFVAPSEFDRRLRAPLVNAARVSSANLPAAAAAAASSAPP